MEKTIERFISQKCIGYTEDYSGSIIESWVEFTDGKRGTVWYVVTGCANGMERVGQLLDTRPPIAHPQEG